MSIAQASALQTRWCLVASTAGRSGARSVPIHVTPFVVGRRRDAHLALDCPSVSGRHAEIVAQGDALRVRDLDSTNGTFVNGRRVTELAPVSEGDYLQFASLVFRLDRESEVPSSATVCEGASDQSLALVQFDKLMSQKAVIPYFQPIVQLSDSRRIGYEVLARSRLFGLQSPGAMFSAAETLEQEAALSRLCRLEAVMRAREFENPPPLFVNTHPRELDDLAELRRSLAQLREQYARWPLVLEIHEAAVTNPWVIRELRSSLNDLDMRLAYDDFGTGRARLLELVEVPPDYLKFDMSFTRGIAIAPFAKQHILATLVQNTRELGIVSVAEGIETAEEHESCLQLGFELGQGYHYGRPAPDLHLALA